MGCSLCTIRASTKTTVTVVILKFIQCSMCYELRDNIVEMLQEVTNDVRIEPILQTLTGEEQSVGGNV